MNFSTFPNVELLRSHNAIEWPGGFENHSFVNLSSSENYRELLLMLHLHNRTINPDRNYGINGVYQSLYQNAKSDVERLVRGGLLRFSTEQETISCHTVADLLAFAETLGLSINSRAKKDELIQKILPYAQSQKIRNTIDAERVFRLTEQGFVMARSLYAERDFVERKIYDAFWNNDTQGAIKAWENYKGRQYGQSVTMYFNTSVLKVSDKEQRVILACRELYGGAPMYHPDKAPSDEALYSVRRLLAQDDIDRMKDASIEYFKSFCPCDHKTCEVCARHDGVPLKVDNAIIGENCPPFHIGCRCSAVVVLPYKLSPGNSQRSARNPITGKSGIVKAKTYFDWVKTLTPDEEEALIKKRGW